MRYAALAGALLLGALTISAPVWADHAPAVPSAIQTAVADPARPAKDREADASRMPGQTLAFFGIKPGMHVLDLLAGGGYFTELLARAVGPDGKVYAQNNKAWRDFLGKPLAERYAGQRLPNAVQWDRELDALDLKPNSLDAVVLIQGFHDFYYISASWPKVDSQAVLKAVHSALKPGGVFGIVDHAAAPGQDIYADGSKLHRITEQRVKELITAAGFVLVAESPLLRNPADDHTKEVFDPAIRGKTDQFMLRFRKG